MAAYLDWIEEKCDLALKLEAGALGGTYAEGAIILCSTISAMSSMAWSGIRYGDRKKFTEIIVKFCVDSRAKVPISVPLFCRDFPILANSLGVISEPICYDSNIDKPEDEVIRVCDSKGVNISKKNMREYSYVNLLYREIRCGFSHEYQPGVYATEASFLTENNSSKRNFPSYVNKGFDDPEGLNYNRLIHFPLVFIANLARRIANGLDKESERLAIPALRNLGMFAPENWWIDGMDDLDDAS